MWKPYSRSLILLIAVLACYVIASAFVENRYYQIILASVPIWASLATSWNVFSGYSGLGSFGHASFFGVGAFTITLLQIHAGLNPWLGLLAAIVMGAVVAVAIGLVTFRLRGHYFALAMLAYPLSLMYVFEWLGFHEISIPLNREKPLLFMQFTEPFHYTVFAVVLLAACAIISLFIERSRFGLILQTIKQDEMAAKASGISLLYWKTVTLAVSGAMGSAAGAVYVEVLLVTTAREVFGVFVSASALIFAMFGGAGSFWGPLIGAVILVPLSEALRASAGEAIPALEGVVYGAAIVLVAKLMPEGIFWRVYDLMASSRPRRSTISAVSVASPVEKGVPGSLVLSNISLAFGAVQVAKDISLTIKAGSITGIVGPNGAGKTSLFNIVNGFLAPSAGDIVMSGTSIKALGTHARALNGLGRTFQVARVFARLSVFDNILAGATAKTPDMDEARKLATWAAHIAELDDCLDMPASQVSAFHVRLIEIARALAGRPTVLLLDETLAGLSHDESFEIVRIVKKLREQGITIVIIEHTMSAMVQLVDRMIVLDQGSLLADGPPREVLRDKRVITAYLGSKWAANA
jgi:ABC-type branched-subunit amino acid transport system ATPase component/ABC-type branched-subunit amino acid transport system permease subunit